MSRRRRVGRVRRRTPETILLSLKRRRERAERRAPHVRETDVGVAAQYCDWRQSLDAKAADGTPWSNLDTHRAR